jgi:hypothetical protein
VGALRIAAIAMLALLAGAAQASAASTPRFIGTGHDPGVAVDRAGTAHVAWFGAPAPGTYTLEYCRFPRRARTCALRHTFPLPRDGSAKVQVLTPRPGAVHIVAPVLNDDTLLLNSGDGGATFGSVALGDTGTIERALYGPGDTISMLSQTGPASFGRFGLDGSGPGGLPVGFAAATESLETALAPWGAGLLAAFSGAATRTVLWNGVGDPNLQQSWAEGPRPGADRTAVTAAGGRSGTYVAYTDRRGGRSDVRIRRVRANGRFGKAKRLTRNDPVTLHLAQGPRGDMALVWRFLDDAYVVRSNRKGRRWTRPRRLVRGNQPEDLRTALGRRGGWMVWDGSAGNFGSNPIRIAAIPRAPRR